MDSNSVQSRIVKDGLLTQSLVGGQPAYPAEPPLYNEIDTRVNIDKARRNPDYYKDFKQMVKEQGMEYECHSTKSADGHTNSLFRVKAHHTKADAEVVYL